MAVLSLPAPATAGAAPASFDRHIRLVTLRHAEILLWMFIAAVLALWPTDRLLFADAPEIASGVGVWRAVMIAIDVAGIVVARRLRRAPEHLVFPAVSLFAVLNGVALGRWLAIAGGAEPTWFYASYAVPVALLPLLMPLVQRILVTAAVLFACTAAFFSDAGVGAGAVVGTSVATLFSVGAMSVALGHLYYRLARADWDAREELRARAAERAAKVRALLGHVERAEDGERRRIGRELHDDLAQLLTVLRLEVGLALHNPDGDPTAALERIDKVVDQLVEAKRRLVAGLQPAPLEQLGFSGAVATSAHEVCDRAGLGLDLRIDADELDPDHPAAVVAYRAVQEALTNVARHANASEVRIEAVAAPDRLCLEVADDGVGFVPTEGRDGFGLAGLRERVSALGGGIEIDTAPGRGTRVAVWIPLGE